MPIGYEYRCHPCDHNWLLFSRRLTLGPVQWGETKYTCFACQTFLSVAKTVDASSWSIWLANNESVKDNAVLAHLVEEIESRLRRQRGIVPLCVDFLSPECPTCNDPMSTARFGDRLMKCPRCRNHTGGFQDENGISIYG